MQDSGYRTDRIKLDYELQFTAPFHMGTGLRRGLVHRAVARDPQGFPFVPGSSVKGVARERCEQLAGLFELGNREPHREAAEPSDFGPGLGIVEEIFGSRTRPGTLCFDDALLHPDDQQMFASVSVQPEFQARYREFQVEPRTRVQMSRVTGTARTGHLFASEYGLREMRFAGSIRGVLRGIPLVDAQMDITYPLVLLVAGILAVESLGGGRSCGAGSCEVAIQKLAVNGEDCKPDEVLTQLGDLEYYEMARG